jgi:hypothetical protein
MRRVLQICAMLLSGLALLRVCAARSADKTGPILVFGGSGQLGSEIVRAP